MSSIMELADRATCFGLFVSPPRRQRFVYHSQNRCRESVDLWLALPRVRPGQQDICVEFVQKLPVGVYAISGADSFEEVHDLSQVLNEPESIDKINAVARFRIGSKERLKLTCTYEASAVQLAALADRSKLEREGWSVATSNVHLGSAEREYYLRSTRFVQKDSAVEREARRIADMDVDASSAVEPAEALVCAARLFDCLTTTRYRYAWPPARRGSSAMRETRVGDCGSYSCLMTAWCRSIGIPARVLIGSWARGRGQGHAWNEIHIDGIGWIPVDATVASAMKRDPGEYDGWLDRPPGLMKRSGDEFFGGVDRGRLVFSVEMEPHSLPGYTEVGAKPEDGEHSFDAGMEWGRGLMGGKVPYMQPAYPRVGRDVEGTCGLRETWRFTAALPHRIAGFIAAASVLFGCSLLGAQILRTDSIFSAEIDPLLILGLFAIFGLARATTGHNRRLNYVVAVILVGAIVLRVIGP
ncbi:MAG: transglutaminase-like domain-containing protein [Longimicrobiales bacterium]